MYIFYPDVYFVLQFMVMIFTFESVEILLNLHVSRKRKGLTSVVAALLETILLLILPNIWLYECFVHILVIPFSVKIRWKPESKQRMMEEWVLCYITTFGLNGCVQWIYNETGWSGIFPTLVSAVVLYTIIRVGKWLLGKIPESCEVVIQYQETVLRAKGLIDTGNLLYDPIFGEPVSLGAKEFMVPILCKYQSPRMPILYKTTSGHGTMDTIVVDYLQITVRGKKVCRSHARIGIVEQNSFGQSANKLLIHKGHIT